MDKTMSHESLVDSEDEHPPGSNPSSPPNELSPKSSDHSPSDKRIQEDVGHQE